MSSDAIYLSVVIPAYNEQSRIADTLYAVKDYLAQRPYRSEIIVVDDGSQDLTLEVARVIDIVGAEFREQAPGLIIENEKNVGKGYAIARGLLRSRGDPLSGRALRRGARLRVR